MSKYNVEIGGFTMVPDALVKEFGFFTAGVYGKIWRYEQMSDEVCRAALGTLGKELGANSETIKIHLSKLVDGGYITDLSPDLRHRPHIYKTTGKLKLRISVAEIPLLGNESVAEIPLPQLRNFRVKSDSIKRQEEKIETKNAMPSMDPLAPPEKASGRRINVTDPLRSHSAIQAIKEVTGYYPPKKLYQFVIDKLGEDVDKSTLWRCCTVMLSKGYNPRNYNCLLEWYSTDMYYVAKLDKAILENTVNPYLIIDTHTREDKSA